MTIYLRELELVTQQRLPLVEHVLVHRGGNGDGSSHDKCKGGVPVTQVQERDRGTASSHVGHDEPRREGEARHELTYQTEGGLTVVVLGQEVSRRHQQQASCDGDGSEDAALLGGQQILEVREVLLCVQDNGRDDSGGHEGAGGDQRADAEATDPTDAVTTGAPVA